MGYPEGGSLLFNDGLPIVSMLSKLAFQATGLRANPFGPWIFLCYVLQGMMAVRVVRSLGTRSISAAAGGAALAVCCVPFMWRLGHIALSGQFVILWSLALYFSSVRDRRLALLELVSCASVTLLVNPYLFAMVMAIQIATVVAFAVDTRPGRRFWLSLFAAYASVVAIGILAGYGEALSESTSMRAAGFGVYSWNPPTLVVPPEAFWGIPRGFVRDATGGQYEGEAYIGAGSLLVLVAFLLVERTTLRAALVRHRVLCLTLVALAVFAASNKVYVSSILLVSYYLPDWVIGAASMFRVTGRFIWPVAYALMLVPMALAHRRWHASAATVLTIVAIVLQVTETRTPRSTFSTYSSQVLVDLIDSPRTSEWMRQHERVWQYPSWECGGLVRTGRAYGSRDVNQELQLQLLAAKLGRPTNSILMSRARKNCAVEALWAQTPRLEPQVFYLLGRESVGDSPRIARLVNTSACKPMEWGFACSLSWLVDPTERDRQPWLE
jgi:hypothetical protein